MTKDFQLGLPAMRQPVGILPQFYAKKPETIVLKEKIFSLSGDSFDVKTAEGQNVLRVQGTVFSLSGRKHVTDMQDNALFTIRKELLSIPASFYLEDPHGQKVVTIEGKFSCKFLLCHFDHTTRSISLRTYIDTVGSTKSSIRFTNAGDGQPVELKMDGNFFGNHCQVINANTNEPVAQIDRERWNARQFLAQQQTYAVHVAPGMDLSVVAAICICLDERKHEEK